MAEKQTKFKQKEDPLKRKEKGVDASLQKMKESRERTAAAKRKGVSQKGKNVLEAAKSDWGEEERVKQTKVFEKIITLNVRGTRYTTALSTLTKCPDSKLAAMFSGRHDLPQQEDGSYFIDRDGEVFKYILMYLRDRDHCFAIFYDEDLHNPNQRVPSLSQKERQIFRSIAFEAKYFQVTELGSMALISLNAGEGNLHATAGIHKVQNVTQSSASNPFIQWFMGTEEQKSYHLDYGEHTLVCPHSCANEVTCTHQCISMNCKYSEARKYSEQMTGTNFVKKITFDSCDLSGVAFCNCYFQKGVSFEGCILHGTKFERVGGLVRHKVHFTPWQVAQADFEPELLQALKDNGCIY